MANNYYISDHAKQRLNERFQIPEGEVFNILHSSVLLGGQQGNNYALINEEHNIAFILVRMPKTDIVKTVMTIDMLRANLSQSIGIVAEPISIAERVNKIRNESRGAISQKAARRLYEEKKRAEGAKEEYETDIKPWYQQTCQEDAEKKFKDDNRLLITKIALIHYSEELDYFPTDTEHEQIERELIEQHKFTEKELNRFWRQLKKALAQKVKAKQDDE